MYKLYIWSSGLLFSVVLGNIIVKWFNFILRRYIGAEEKPAKLTPAMGCIERAIYTILTVFGYYNFVVTFFGLKIAQRLITFTRITNDDELKKAGQHANVFLICNILSLGFGIFGGIIIRYFISPSK